MNSHLFNKPGTLLGYHSCLHGIILSANNKKKHQDTVCLSADRSLSVSVLWRSDFDSCLPNCNGPESSKNNMPIILMHTDTHMHVPTETHTHTGNCAHLGKHHLVRRPFLLLTLLLQHVCVFGCMCVLVNHDLLYPLDAHWSQIAFDYEHSLNPKPSNYNTAFYKLSSSRLWVKWLLPTEKHILPLYSLVVLSPVVECNYNIYSSI